MTLYCLVEFEGQRYRYPKGFELPRGARLIRESIDEKHEAAALRLWPIREVKSLEKRDETTNP